MFDMFFAVDLPLEAQLEAKIVPALMLGCEV